MPDIIVDQQSVRKLLAAGNGDAALLYLCRTAGLSDVATGFSAERLERAASLLRQLGMDPSGLPRFQQGAEPPAYTDDDVRRKMDGAGSGFSRLVSEVQRCLGRVLSTEELKILLSMSDYLGLPHEVISILVHYCVERSRERGAGRRPSLRMIEKEAYRWADEGIDTMDRAAAFLQQQAKRSSRQAELCAIIGLQGRRPTQTEEKYLAAWSAMGFSDEVIRLAYDKTCVNTGSFKWAYMNSILKSWDSQGLYTLEQISTLDRKSGARQPSKKNEFQRHGQELSPMMRQAVADLLKQEQEG